MRGLLDSFNNLSIILRIVIIIAIIVMVAFGAMKLMEFLGDDTPTEDIADDMAIAPEEAEYTDTDVTDGGESQINPEDEEAMPEDDMTDDALPPEEEIIEGEEEYDPALDIDGEGDTEDPASIIDEEQAEPNTDADSASDDTDKSSDEIKSEQTPELQAIWEDKDWKVVTYYNTFDPDTISVEFPEGDAEAIDTYGSTMVDLSLLSIEVPDDVRTQATERIKSFITDADTIVVEQEPGNTNPNRVYIHADFVNVQEVLLEEGLAKVSTEDGDTQYMDSFKEYEQSAKDDKLGVWAE